MDFKKLSKAMLDIVSGDYKRVIDKFVGNDLKNKLGNIFPNDEDIQNKVNKFLEENLKSNELDIEMEKLRIVHEELVEGKFLDIIKSESQSEDSYVRRARPTYMYVFYTIIIFNYVGLKIAEIFGKKIEPINFPSEMWYIFIIGYLGYAGLRTIEKNGGMSSLFQKLNKK